MNVLFLTHSYPRFAEDPVGSFVLRLAVALGEQGVRVRVLAPAGPGLAPEDVYEGIPVRRFRYAPSSLESLAYTGTMLAQVRTSWSAKAALAGFLSAGVLAARRGVRRWPADLLHAHWAFPGGAIAAAARAGLGVPLVTTLHGSDLRIARDVPLAARVFRSVLRHSSAVTAVSGWLAREAAALVPGVAPLVEPMPIASGLFHPGGRRERDRLLFVGKLTAQKGFEPLLEALRLMERKPLVDIVVGVGSAITDGQRMAEAHGVAGQLRWHSLVEQAALADLYRRATALVVPSIDEGLGLVAVEALLCETPVVAFASGGLVDSVVHERTGLLVPPGDAAGLARALEALLSRPDQGEALGKLGRQELLRRFAPATVGARYAALYRGLRGDA